MYGDSYAVKQHITMEDLLYRCQHVVRTEVDVIRNQMAPQQRDDAVRRRASSSTPHTIRVVRGEDDADSVGEAVEIKAHHVLIAVGTEPARPRDVPFTPGRVIDSNELL